MNDPRNITLSGVPEGYDARAILDEIAKGGQPVVHVARDDKRMAAMQAALREQPEDRFSSSFFTDCRVSYKSETSFCRLAF